MIGPHFYFDLIRLPRKGWSTVLRCLYLLILLIGLMIMYESQRSKIRDYGDYAAFAQNFAYTLIAMQDILVLVLLPVYVASAVAEERENGTLESLFISPLDDWQIVVGKFGGRLLHLGAVILAGVPLLAFMHLWGNVALTTLVYHLANTLLLAMTCSAVCILVSTNSPVVFQAVIGSYPFVFVIGAVDEFLAFGLPNVLGEFGRAALHTEGDPWYWASLSLLLPVHILLTWQFLLAAIVRMKRLRKLEIKPMRKTTGSFALADAPKRPPRTHKGNLLGSHINPLALPIRAPALFWKECQKDGTFCSLTWEWFAFAFVGVIGAGLLLRVMDSIAYDPRYAEHRPLIMANIFGGTAYFIALAAYALAFVFQTTFGVAGEREQNTLEFLLLLPVERREIIFCKWLGPLWRNWPILAIAFLGVVLCLAAGVFSIGQTLAWVLLPCAFLLTFSFTALWLSVTCRRVLFANILMVSFLLLVLVGHIVAASYLESLGRGYVYLLFQGQTDVYDPIGFWRAAAMVSWHQAAFLLWALYLGWSAFARFCRKN